MTDCNCNLKIPHRGRAKILGKWIFSICIIATGYPAHSQSMDRYDGHVTDLMVMASAAPWGRTRQSFSIILDKYTGAFTVCQTYQFEKKQPLSECITTPALVPTSTTARFKIIASNDSRFPIHGSTNTTLSPEMVPTFIIDTSSRKMWVMVLNGRRGANGAILAEMRPLVE